MTTQSDLSFPQWRDMDVNRLISGTTVAPELQFNPTVVRVDKVTMEITTFAVNYTFSSLEIRLYILDAGI